jgi:hypothetical protein
MRLKNWLGRELKTVRWLHGALEAKLERELDYSHLARIANGEAEPGLELAGAIEEITEFEVKAADLVAWNRRQAPAPAP